VIRRFLSIALPVALVVGLVFVPKISADIPKLLPGAINSPGTLQLFATCLIFAGLAMTYDLLFGFTGLLSFGHALYFAVGVYLPAIAMTRWHWNFVPALALTAGVGLLLPLVVGFVSLRVTGIAFAMVTLAFAQVGAVLVIKNPHDWTHGEEGFATDYRKLPASLVGVFNTKHLYWVALGFAVVVFLLIRWAVQSSPGRVWQAIRENELRVEVLGLRPHWFKLMAFVLSSFLATAGGAVYLLVFGGATPDVTSPNVTLTLLIMVVLGGTGTRWGAVIGGVLYTYLDKQALPAIGGSSTVEHLPGVLRTPISQPLFLLGALFILIVFFLPGGIARLSVRGRRAGLRRLEQTIATPSAPVGGIEEAT